MSALPLAFVPVLAEATSPVFLMSVAKPLITLAIFIPYAALVSDKLAKDAAAYNLKPIRWSAIFMAFAAAAFLAAVLTPWWVAGTAAQVALLVAPCLWYVKYRNKTATSVPPLRLYNIDLEKMATDRRAKSARSSVSIRFQNKDRVEIPVPDLKSPEYPVYVAMQEVLVPILETRTQRMDIALTKAGAAISQMTDGIRAKREPLGPDRATPVVDLLKTIAGLDANERRKYQRGSITVLFEDRKLVLTVSTAGSMQGESIRVDVERDKQLTIPLAHIGMLEAQLKAVKDFQNGETKGGVVLIGAKPGQGLTTLGYTLLSGHDAFISNIKTLERRPERQVDGVEHSTFDASKAEYSTQLQTIVRRGPDVVLVTDAGEPGVAKVVSSPGARATTFYVQIPSDNPVDILAAWLKASGDPDLASDALRMVITCRTMRRLCPACRVAYQPTPDVMKMLAIPAGKSVQLYRHSGKVLVKDQPTDCPTCNGLGYLGLTGAFEVLPLDEESRNMLKSGDVKAAYLQARRTNRALSLQEAALMRVRAGDTSLEEVKRVFAAPAAPSAPAAPRAAAS